MRNERAIKLLTLVLLIVFLTTGCASTSIGTIKPQINNPQFKAENLPIRTLRTAVFSDGIHDRKSINKLIIETSKSLEEQVGICLKIVSFKPIKWQGKSRKKRLQHLYYLTINNQNKFDIAIAFTWYSPFDLAIYFTIGTWQGCIDDTYRRFIIIKSLTKYVLMHEISHAFIFSHVHSNLGLMQGTILVIIPGLSPLNQTIYLAPQDRKEILQNKWRDFNVEPPLKNKHKSDPLKKIKNTKKEETEF